MCHNMQCLTFVASDIGSIGASSIAEKGGFVLHVFEKCHCLFTTVFSSLISAPLRASVSCACSSSF